MTIQAITPEDTWPIRHAVMWPDKPLSFVQLAEDEAGYHYGLYRGDRLISVISCFETGAEMQFRKFATLVEFQGQGLGSQLLAFILTDARRRGIRRVWCNARRDKKNFYEKFGMAETGKRFSREGLEYTEMAVRLA